VRELCETYKSRLGAPPGQHRRFIERVLRALDGES
jgi:hypothetical protein